MRIIYDVYDYEIGGGHIQRLPEIVFENVTGDEVAGFVKLFDTDDDLYDKMAFWQPPEIFLVRWYNGTRERRYSIELHDSVVLKPGETLDGHLGMLQNTAAFICERMGWKPDEQYIFGSDGSFDGAVSEDMDKQDRREEELPSRLL